MSALARERPALNEDGLCQARGRLYLGSSSRTLLPKALSLRSRGCRGRARARRRCRWLRAAYEAFQPPGWPDVPPALGGLTCGYGQDHPGVRRSALSAGSRGAPPVCRTPWRPLETSGQDLWLPADLRP